MWAKYLINILLFIIFYCIQMFPIVAYSGAYGTIAPTALGSIICLFTSYFIVKLIRKSKSIAKMIMIAILGIFLIIIIRDFILYILIPYLNGKPVFIW